MEPLEMEDVTVQLAGQGNLALPVLKASLELLAKVCVFLFVFVLFCVS